MTYEEKVQALNAALDALGAARVAQKPRAEIVELAKAVQRATRALTDAEYVEYMRAAVAEIDWEYLGEIWMRDGDPK